MKPEPKSTPSREFIEWADSFCNQHGATPTPWEAWEAAFAHAVRSGHACMYAMDHGGNIYKRYREPQCTAGVDLPDGGGDGR